MRTSHTPIRATWAMAICIIALLPCTPSASHAARTRQAQDASGAPHTPARKARSGRMKPQQNHSGESTAERDRRLYRECQGLPNAGACLGYTRR